MPFVKFIDLRTTEIRRLCTCHGEGKKRGIRLVPVISNALGRSLNRHWSWLLVFAIVWEWKKNELKKGGVSTKPFF